MAGLFFCGVPPAGLPGLAVGTPVPETCSVVGRRRSRRACSRRPSRRPGGRSTRFWDMRRRTAPAAISSRGRPASTSTCSTCRSSGRRCRRAGRPRSNWTSSTPPGRSCCRSPRSRPNCGGNCWTSASSHHRSRRGDRPGASPQGRRSKTRATRARAPNEEAAPPVARRRIVHLLVLGPCSAPPGRRRRSFWNNGGFPAYWYAARRVARGELCGPVRGLARCRARERVGFGGRVG